MGTKRFDNVADCALHGADLLIRCWHCRHEVVLSVGRMAEMVRKRRNGHYAMRWQYGTVSQAFRCSRCGTNRPIVEPTMKSR